MNIPPFVYAATAIFFWAGNAIVGKLAAHAIPAFTLTFGRWVLASLLFAPFAVRAVWQQRNWYRAHLPFMALLAFLSVTLYNSFQHLALTFTSPGNIGIVGASTPMFVLLLNARLNRIRIKPHQVLGIALAMCGVISILLTGGHSLLKLNPGDFIMLTATVGFSLYSVLLKRLPGDLSAPGVLLVIMVLGVIGCLPFYATDLKAGHTWDWQSGRNWAMLAYVAVLPSIASFVFWNLAVKRGGPFLTGLSFNPLPVFTLAMAAAFLDEPVDKSQLLAVALVFSGILIGLKPSQKPERSGIAR